MQSADPCVVCGGEDLKLIDGYYYCVECGTQNTNVRETVVEQKTLGDGTFAMGTRRKIVRINDSKIQMSGEWYKWHAYNFVISGLADELVAAGAKPSFKLKLLWLWTRYIKKYQNKDALRFAEKPQEEGNNDNITFPSFMVEENSNSNPIPDEEEEEPGNDQKNSKINKNVIMDGSKRDIKFLSKGVIIAMLYLALNLDNSDIQLYHLLRYIKEKRLNFFNIQRFLPDDINVKSIQEEWLKFIHSKVCNVHRVRAFAMTLLRKLDLGTPKVPDMRKIIDDFLLELCLPNDIKPMIYSLMFFHRCDFLDMNSKSKAQLVLMPDYQGVAMSYVLVALKMCFGLDGDYEEKLSDAVERINDERNLPKSYRMGKYSEPSARLFSFREWCNYMQFRKITLCKSSLHMAEQHYFDTDDNVYLEHMSDRPLNNKNLQDETAINLISKIPEEDEGRVIPKHMFSPTLTPMTDYTEIIIEHNQDQEIRELLSEDFTRYSLNYACEYLELADTNSENIIKGVSEERKTFSKVILGTIVTKKSKTEMVYVKNCENRNWMITNPPKKEHITCEDELNVSNEKESDHGYDSENPVNENDAAMETDKIDDSNLTIIEDNSLGCNLKSQAKEIEVSELTKNIEDVDQSMHENRRDTDSEHPDNEKTVSTDSENIDVTNHSMNEDNEEVNLENPANEKIVSDVTNQSINEDIEEVNSESAANEKLVSEVNENVDVFDDSMKEGEGNDLENRVNEKEISENITEDKRVFIITEEDSDKNIFDDSFEELDVKDEIELNVGQDMYVSNEDHLPLPNNESLYEDRASISDFSDIDSVFPPFNPDTFDREQTIKELILAACKKYKISIPKEYKTPREPRKRKADVFGNEGTSTEPRKRAKVNRFEVKKKVDELITGYYNLKQADLISQMQEAVSLAIQKTQMGSILNDSNVTQNDIPNLTAEQASDALTRANSIVSHTLENQSNVNPYISILEQTGTEQNKDKTVEEDEIIDEKWESKLFEGEEEMKIDDLIPKGDPKFDEEKYDVNQLYIKIKAEKEDILQNIPANLESILMKKIEQCKNSTEFEKLKAKHQSLKPVKTKYESDSDDELPLNILQEQKKLVEEKIAWEDNFEPLINEANVSEFKYWFRHYDEDFMNRSKDWHKKFDEELKENTPSSFYFVIRECAAILNCSTFSLYKQMQGLEKYIIARAKYPD
ncbi:hypothetical protein PYW07_010261 [Mythimna separata]|uniref:Rrn7/TAF1B C-terminal cyclin domain-containing protein n=1 Tax=Mythimna separata TaxID=271217 RepID=A0AAD7YHS4_MYTSE|nr:hypothetical protein PYW07_010261 [Mythimna separata]